MNDFTEEEMDVFITVMRKVGIATEIFSWSQLQSFAKAMVEYSKSNKHGV